MSNSTEDITYSTPEVLYAASILFQLSKDHREQSPKEDIIRADVASSPLLQVNQTHHKLSRKRKRVDKKQDENSKCDDSKQTLMLMLNYKYNTPDYPPRRMFVHDPDAVGNCSKPIRKQLTKSDVKDTQSRLMLGQEQVEKMMLEVLGETMKLESDGLNVSVYGRDGIIHEIKFKKWNKVTPVLMCKVWKEFVRTYDLKENCYFLTIWMFKHKRTHQICFAIDSTWFPVYKKLSNRIMKAAAFKN